MIKKPVVSGIFYPNNESKLKSMLNSYFENCQHDRTIEKKLVAIISPHAGYLYSGQTAAHSFHLAKKHDFKTAIIIAPAHSNVSGDFFIGDYEEYETPLGNLKTDRFSIEKLLDIHGFSYDTKTDLKEHSLETQLPFLYHINPNVKIIPIIIKKQSFENARKLAIILNDLYTEDSLIVISNDLSHFHNAQEAEKMDKLFIEYIINKDINCIERDLISRKIEACGYGGILTLLHFIKNIDNVSVTNDSYTHSGYVSKDFNSVVGYFGCGVYRNTIQNCKVSNITD